jgi:prephenate dehydratase
MTTACFGEKGSFTEKAIRLKKKLPAQKIAYYPLIELVFEAVLQGKAATGYVPSRNKSRIPEEDTIDALFDYAGRVSIIDSVVMPIEHSVGKLPGNEPIRRILSRKTALKQCRPYLKQHYPGAEPVYVESTSEAMKQIRDQNLADAAAIGNKDSLKLYGLEVIAENIVPNNKTRFIVLSREISWKRDADKPHVTSIIYHPHENRPGLLADILKVPKKLGINIAEIHSVPDENGEYAFLIDLEGHVLDRKITKCRELMDKQCKKSESIILGCYPYRPLN